MMNITTNAKDYNYDYHYSYGKEVTGYDARHNHFGGMVYDGDYDYYHSMSDIADRIILDMKWEESLSKVAMRKRAYQNRGEN